MTTSMLDHVHDLAGGGFLRLKEAGAFLAVGEEAVERLIRDGQLSVARVGPRRR
jgi:excisionase family DNA binding protein